jgi:hypothetical protein
MIRFRLRGVLMVFPMFIGFSCGGGPPWDFMLLPAGKSALGGHVEIWWRLQSDLPQTVWNAGSGSSANESSDLPALWLWWIYR